MTERNEKKKKKQNREKKIIKIKKSKSINQVIKSKEKNVSLPDEAEKQRAEHFRGRDREPVRMRRKNPKRKKKTQYFKPVSLSEAERKKP